ncbi:hypothetical protein IOK49_05545 [Fervidicoccus fontis]|jgi:hypothetical protein|uniref:Uncharacterized protein n=2 Tax=Fervidicoccus fontis TaxID=683846 RepID=I0A1Q4_FERFK|nr:hypothetical protein [Fervidicoccus fontis]AFH42911.1 hypothetical protein FFONT_0923 [Fervidicoccus fontis Kam940]MBE9391532.1 hypothetical protein [Fervidicoccus fontis]PMB77203.1 MAG: hypothetical protein C0177_03985 [Fervidicoccus fontis]HEW63598.1 hypothetical protein [Fervidicoccus fontis]
MQKKSQEFLKSLVDGEIILAVYLLRLEEGIITYWPPEYYDDEIEKISDLTSVPLKEGLYFVLGGDRLKEKYIGLVINKNILLFRVRDDFNAEKIAEKLSSAYLKYLNDRGKLENNFFNDKDY